MRFFQDSLKRQSLLIVTLAAIGILISIARAQPDREVSHG